MNSECLETNWGGKRNGAGRKPSKIKGRQMWIPAHLVLQVEQLLNLHNANQDSPTLEERTAKSGAVSSQGVDGAGFLSPDCNTGYDGRGGESSQYFG